MFSLKRTAVLGAAVLILTGNMVRAADAPVAPNLDVALRDQGPKLLAALKERGYKNVGVLKFLVGNEGGKLRDNFGPLNRSLADRVELSLLLGIQKGDDFGVIFRASDVVKASGNERATHLTKEGRDEFFGFDPSPFSLPWNSKVKVQPDAFLTGDAWLSPDHRTLTVAVKVFDRKSTDKLTELTRFTAAVDFRTLTEAGVSFVGARGPYDQVVSLDQPAPDVVKDAAKPPTTKEAWQAQAEALLRAMKETPLRVDILYNDQAIPLDANPFAPPAESANALLRIREPFEREKVGFRLTNTSATETFGVVIQINGQSTIFREEKGPLDCYKWILGPKKSTVIEGFQLDNKNTLEFKVKSDAESRSEEVNYGNNAGTFTIVVFRAASSQPDREMVSQVKEERAKRTDVALIARGTEKLAGQVSASDPLSFQMNLRELTAKAEAGSHQRGIVGTGGMGSKEVKDVEFHALPVPAYSATIRYYDPKGK
jgi:hypothetical protein